jgi:cytoskeleton protein RodZ
MSATASSPFHEGRALRRARQRRQITLDDAAEATRIPRRFLEALEREAPVDHYPAPVYARAFLREYARYLGLPPERLVEGFTARNGVHEPGLAAIPTTVVRPQRRWPGRILAVMSVGAVITLGVIRSESSGSLTPNLTPAPPLTAAAAAPATGPVKPPELRAGPVPPAARGIQVVIRVIERCWVEATGDGKTVLPGQTLTAGRSVTLAAHHTLALRLGNAGGVRITINGHHLTAGGPGQVVDLSFAWRNGRVVSL